MDPPSTSSVTCGKQGKTSPVSVSESTMTIEIDRFLECSACLNFSTSPIHSCANGHILCGQCATKFRTCQICKHFLSPNPICEKFAKEVSKKIQCPNFEAGCNEVVLSTEFVDHLRSCYFREVKCDYVPNCSLKVVKFQEYIKHIQAAHKEKIIVGPKFIEGYAYAKKNVCKTDWEKFQSVMKFENQVFVCHLQISRLSQLLFSWVSVLGDKDLAKKYSCGMKLRTSYPPPGTGFRCSWKIPVIAFHEISDTGSEANLSQFSEVWSIPMNVIKNWDQENPNDKEIHFDVTYKIRAA